MTSPRLPALPALFLLVTVPLPAQDSPIEWEEIPREHLIMKSYAPDSNAAALILCDYGETTMNSQLNLVFMRHMRIKIFSERAYDRWGTHSVTLNETADGETLNALEGATYVIDADGEVEAHELDDDMIFKERITGDRYRYRFTFPALTPGCIVGIRSHPVLIDPGERRYPMIVDYPNNQFTHVILCVPVTPDTIWLECTDQSFPAGHLGGGSEDLYPLLLTEVGGKVLRTPASHSRENTQLRDGVAEVQQTGNAHASVYMTYAGCQRDRVQGALYNRSPEEQQRWLIQSLDIAHGNLSHYEIGDLATRDPEFSMMFELSLPRFATATGNRLFFYPGAMDRQFWVPPESKDRRSDLIVAEYAYLDSDSIVYMIPSTYTVEALPATVHMETSFGSFVSSTEPAGENLLLFRRRLDIRTPQIAATQYGECRDFFAGVAKSDRSQVVLIRKASREHD